MNEEPHILVVEDDADARALLLYIFQTEGYRVSVAEHGQAAVACLEQELPDVIVCDLMMPIMGGLEVLQTLRSKYPSAHVPFLVLTAKDDVQQKVEALNCGADDYITKPYHHHELTARVRALYRIKSLTSKLHKRTEELEQANVELSKAQAQLVKKERQLLAAQLAGATAHRLGQPVTAILLNCKILEHMLSSVSEAGTLELSTDQSKRPEAIVSAIRSECETVREVLSLLRVVDSEKTESYVGDINILRLEKE